MPVQKVFQDQIINYYLISPCVKFFRVLGLNKCSEVIVAVEVVVEEHAAMSVIAMLAINPDRVPNMVRVVGPARVDQSNCRPPTWSRRQPVD